MMISAYKDWREILSGLNSILLRSDRWKSDLSEESLTTGWCGSRPASEEDILIVEERLGVKLPLSYRAFLSISNGWCPFNSFIERLLPVQEISQLQIAAPDTITALQSCYQEGDVSDSEYLDYETPEHMTALRNRYYPESILVGKS